MIAADISARSEGNVPVPLTTVPVTITCGETSSGKDMTNEVRTLSRALVLKDTVKEAMEIPSSHSLEVGVIDDCYLGTTRIINGMSRIYFFLKAPEGPCSAGKGCGGMFRLQSPTAAVATFRNSNYQLSLE